ncbi:uncharacterized protein BX664DRAFT_334319 [Halteromyces radiatus]|uniref:uncharacterized protein n=1 Tax=Halteromyces radiatus TaxID=101107 RepID=UPI002220BB02|nr:uncharacterized protein BX664DRAFT_334319 [Halteromyces radiatus]KAI8089960.1 hypothetical protein BX664DRAFT_334319 [Halteromyces radiatus]
MPSFSLFFYYYYYYILLFCSISHFCTLHSLIVYFLNDILFHSHSSPPLVCFLPTHCSLVFLSLVFFS